MFIENPLRLSATSSDDLLDGRVSLVTGAGGAIGGGTANDDRTDPRPEAVSVRQDRRHDAYRAVAEGLSEAWSVRAAALEDVAE